MPPLGCAGSLLKRRWLKAYSRAPLRAPIAGQQKPRRAGPGGVLQAAALVSNLARREQIRDGGLDRCCGGARVRRVADRPPHHDVIGAIAERLCHVHNALLVV